MPPTTKVSTAPPERLHNAHPRANNPPAPAVETESKNFFATKNSEFLASPSRRDRDADAAYRDSQAVDAANKAAFARLRPLQARTPVVTPGFIPPRTHDHIERAFEASGLPRQDWHLEGVCSIREVILISQILDQLGRSEDRATQLVRLEKARTHIKALECAFMGAKAAVDLAEVICELNAPSE
jgi:hypothetical protein